MAGLPSPTWPDLHRHLTWLQVHVSGSGGEWHLEGEFETRRVVLDLDKETMGRWPCLMKADAPDDPPPKRAVLSGAAGDVDNIRTPPSGAVC